MITAVPDQSAGQIAWKTMHLLFYEKHHSDSFSLLNQRLCNSSYQDDSYTIYRYHPSIWQRSAREDRRFSLSLVDGFPDFHWWEDSVYDSVLDDFPIGTHGNVSSPLRLSNSWPGEFSLNFLSPYPEILLYFWRIMVWWEGTTSPWLYLTVQSAL